MPGPSPRRWSGRATGSPPGPAVAISVSAPSPLGLPCPWCPRLARTSEASSGALIAACTDGPEPVPWPFGAAFTGGASPSSRRLSGPGGENPIAVLSSAMPTPIVPSARALIIRPAPGPCKAGFSSRLPHDRGVRRQPVEPAAQDRRVLVGPEGEVRAVRALRADGRRPWPRWRGSPPRRRPGRRRLRSLSLLRRADGGDSLSVPDVYPDPTTP